MLQALEEQRNYKQAGNSLAEVSEKALPSPADLSMGSLRGQVL